MYCQIEGLAAGRRTRVSVSNNVYSVDRLSTHTCITVNILGLGLIYTIPSSVARVANTPVIVMLSLQVIKAAHNKNLGIMCISSVATAVKATLVW